MRVYKIESHILTAEVHARDMASALEKWRAHVKANRHALIPDVDDRHRIHRTGWRLDPDSVTFERYTEDLQVIK